MASSSPRSPGSHDGVARLSPVLAGQSSRSETRLRDQSLPSLPSAANHPHRASFAESLRTYPPSPRAQRTHSYSSQQLMDLMASKGSGASDSRFVGRDWTDIQIHEIIDPAETRFVEFDSTIEEATKTLIKGGAPNVILIRESRKSKTALGTFGYSDLNAYLLLVLGLAQPDELAAKLADRARHGEAIPLSDVLDHLGDREQPTILPHTAPLTAAMEALGSGLHRVVVCKEGTTEAVGILTQLRFVRFFWENHESFAVTSPLYALTLKDLEIGAKDVIAINGDRPLADALNLMHNEAITSLPVLDGQGNVVGNISHVDVKLLTDLSAIPLLSSTCIHFISVILSERGLLDGKDSYPVFHVTRTSTLAHTVAKLCATRSHRMWVVEAPSPSPSVPPSPSTHHAVPPLSLGSSAHARQNSQLDATPGPPYTSMNPGVSVSAGQLPGAGTSGRLSGVVSLTDVLNLLARASGLSPANPEVLRRRRRRSSSSSSRRNVDSMRASAEFMRKSTDLGRSPSQSGRR